MQLYTLCVLLICIGASSSASASASEYFHKTNYCPCCDVYNSGQYCFDDNTGYHDCDDMARDKKCPPNTRCVCGTDRQCTGGVESICQVPNLPKPIVDPAIFKFSKTTEKFGSDMYEDDEGWTHTTTGEIRQDIAKGKYISVRKSSSGKPTYFRIVTKESGKRYDGHYGKKTCESRWNYGGPSFIGDEIAEDQYNLYKEWTDKNGTEHQRWETEKGDYESDYVTKTWWVTIRDGHMVPTRYNEFWNQEDGGWDYDDSYTLMSHGGDSSDWFTLPDFCKK